MGHVPFVNFWIMYTFNCKFLEFKWWLNKIVTQYDNILVYEIWTAWGFHEWSV